MANESCSNRECFATKNVRLYQNWFSKANLQIEKQQIRKKGDNRASSIKQ